MVAPGCRVGVANLQYIVNHGKDSGVRVCPDIVEQSKGVDLLVTQRFDRAHLMFLED